MKGLTRELLSAFVMLTLAYLVLVHFTGFGKDIASVGSNTVSIWRTAQGR